MRCKKLVIALLLVFAFSQVPLAASSQGSNTGQPTLLNLLVSAVNVVILNNGAPPDKDDPCHDQGRGRNPSPMTPRGPRDPDDKPCPEPPGQVKHR